MISKGFSSNTVLKGMSYNNDVLSIEFKKGQIRRYNKVPPPIAYKLFYTTTGSQALTIYSNEIKGKFEVLTVKNL
jgi:hypothetical protein